MARVTKQLTDEQGNPVFDDMGVPVMVTEKVQEQLDPVTLLADLAKEKDDKLKAQRKGAELEKIAYTAREARTKNDIEILDITATDYGAMVFIKAWKKDGSRIGFGKDGSVEIERVRLVMNGLMGYVLVPDPAGDITVTDEETGETRTLRADPKEALLRRLEDVVADVGKDDSKIKDGKIGNTVTVVDYTQNDSRYIAQDGISVYATAHDATTGTVYNIAGNANHNCIHNSYIGGNYYVRRGELHFNTSSIGAGQVVSALTLTMYSASSGGANADTDTVYFLDDTNNASLTSPVLAEDFDDFGTSQITSKALADYTNIGANVTSGDFGTYSVINVTGTTRIGLRSKHDVDNSTPSGSNVLRIGTGTTGDDPYITVTHSLVPSATDVKNDATLSTSLVSYWELGEASGTRADSHGSNDMGVSQGAPDSTTGIQGDALQIDATEGLKTSTGTFTMTNAASFSIAGWFKPNNAQTSATLFARWNGTSKGFLVRQDASDHVEAYVGDGSTTRSVITATTDIDDTNWHHVAFVWDHTDDKHRLYIDGSLEATASSAQTISQSTADIELGDDTQAGSGAQYAGLVDEVGAWNKALSAQEIVDLYNNGSGIPYEAASPAATSNALALCNF